MREVDEGGSLESCLEGALREQLADWTRGECTPVGVCLARARGLAGHQEAALELIHQEILLRLGRGEKPRVEDYCAEYPELAHSISEILQLHSGLLLPTKLINPTAKSLDPVLTADSETARWLPAIPGYQIERELGRGGMGIVYLAQDLSLKRRVALKLLRDAFANDPTHRARFTREATAAAKCHHPNLIQIFRIGEHNGEFFLALEYVDGQPLTKALASGPQPVQAAAELVQKLSMAVDHAHARGVVHRDLKPANVLISAGGEPKVADFGLARLDDMSTHTEPGAMAGTLAYMAPEQARGEEVGHPADIHALGVILYEALTGRLPFRGESAQSTLHKLLMDEAAAPAIHRAGVPRDLETICLKCLEKSPGKRYVSALELAEDLGRFLRGEPVRARRTGPLRRLGKWGARHPWQSLSAAVLMLAIMSMIILTYHHNIQLRAEIGRTQAKSLEARQNYQDAGATVQVMLACLQDRRFASAPRLKELAHDQMEAALSFYDRALGRNASNDKDVRADTARAYGMLSTVQFELGHPGEAERLVRMSADILQRLREEDDVNQDYLKMHAQSMFRLSHCLRAQGRREEAFAASERAVKTSTILAARTPDDPLNLEVLATSSDAHATSLGELKRVLEARNYLIRAIEIRQKLGPTRVAGLAQRHAETLMNFGVNLWGTREFSKAEEQFREAERFVLNVPTEERNTAILGQLYVNWSGILYESERFAEAAERARSGLVAIEPHVQNEPNNVVARDTCFKLHGNRALALSEMGRHAESAAEWEKVISNCPGPIPPRFKVELATELTKSGDVRRGLGLVRDLRVAPDVTGEDCYYLACLYCRSANETPKTSGTSGENREDTAKSHFSMAFYWIKAAADAGFFREAANRERVKKDADLAVLAKNDEFLRMIAPAE